MNAAISTEHALPMINRLFISALLALAETGKTEQACRLAAQGYSALRQCQTREAKRLDALLHSLTQHSSILHPATQESLMADIGTLDVRSLVPAERHRRIFETYDGLTVGGKFVLVNDHDPKPLYYQFDAEHHGEFSWRYLEQGPKIWRVEIGRTKLARAAAR